MLLQLINRPLNTTGVSAPRAPAKKEQKPKYDAGDCSPKSVSTAASSHFGSVRNSDSQLVLKKKVLRRGFSDTNMIAPPRSFGSFKSCESMPAPKSKSCDSMPAPKTEGKKTEEEKKISEKKTEEKKAEEKKEADKKLRFSRLTMMQKNVSGMM